MTTTMTTAATGLPPAPLRPVARWVTTVDEQGHRRLAMRWHVPDADEALRAVVTENG